MKAIKIILVTALVTLACCIGMMLYLKQPKGYSNPSETGGYRKWFSEPSPTVIASTESAIYFDDAAHEKQD